MFLSSSNFFVSLPNLLCLFEVYLQIAILGSRGWLICVGCVGRSWLRGSELVAWVGVGCMGQSGLSGLSGSKVKPHFHASLISFKKRQPHVFLLF